MPFPNFLEQLPPEGSSPGFAGGHFGGIDQMQGINNALAQNAMRPQQPQQKKGRSFGDILGMIGDAISIGAGGQPIHMMRQEQQRQQQQQDAIQGALANYMDDPEGAIRALIAIDAPTGIKLMQGMRKSDDRPGIIREFDEVSHLPPEQRGQFMEYLKSRFPGQMSPIVMGENDSLEMPGQQEGPAEVFAEDANGNRIRYNPQSQAWEPIGGQTESPSGNFPR